MQRLYSYGANEYNRKWSAAVFRKKGKRSTHIELQTKNISDLFGTSRIFPLQNRPIYPLNIAYLNFKSLQQQHKGDYLMTLYRSHKGIIHTTSYEQLNFIKENISETNKRRFLVT
ncbi:MAG: hypothetical protein WCC17_06880, partial [Candidatus Nitrosopolaris sp.]